MKNKERIIDVNVTINVDAIRAAAGNAAKVGEIALEVPVVDPKDLSIGDQIFGITLLPVKDGAKKSDPNTTVYPAVQAILVDILSGRAKPGFITVNGTIDIAKDGGRVNKLEECYFINQMDAKAVCRVITEVELDRSMARIALEEENSKFLQKQLTDDRF